jgi:hypothetical protein
MLTCTQDEKNNKKFAYWLKKACWVEESERSFIDALAAWRSGH